MAIGDEAQAVVQSYIAVGKEATFGTYASATTAIEAISCSFRVDIASQKLETLHINRGRAKRVQLDKEVKGTLEQFLHPHESVLMVANAMGGGIGSSSLTGAFLHSITAGNFNTSPASLSFQVRKGSSNTQAFNYSGGRCNSMQLAATVGEPVKATYEMIFKDATLTSDGNSTIFSISSVLPFVYTGGVFRYAATETLAATTTVEEPIQSFELTISNNLKSDKDARKLGTNVLTVLPATSRGVELKTTFRFDTTTSFNRFIQATQGAIEIVLSGDSITTEFTHQMTIRLPKVFANSPDPELKGVNDILMSDLNWDVVVDSPSTSTGKDIGITIRNNTASY